MFQLVLARRVPVKAAQHDPQPDRQSGTRPRAGREGTSIESRREEQRGKDAVMPTSRLLKATEPSLSQFASVLSWSKDTMHLRLMLLLLTGSGLQSSRRSAFLMQLFMDLF